VRRPTLLLALCAGALALLAACSHNSGGKPNGAGGTDPTATTVPAATGLHSGLLITRQRSLDVQSAIDGAARTLITPTPPGFVTDPAWSPDGSVFVYVLDVPWLGTGADWGSVLYRVDTTTGAQHALLARTRNGEQFGSPSWTPDGKAIVFGYISAATDSSGVPTGQQTAEIRRLDLASGAVSTLVAGGTSPVLCADGAHLVYVGPASDGTPQSIVMANADGSAPRTVLAVGAGAGGQFVTAVTLPHPSPDCGRIVFAAESAAGHGQALPPEHGLWNALARLLQPAAARADGPPWDLWLVNSDGTGLRRLTAINDDNPDAAWSKDGAQIAFLGTGGLYLVNADGTNLHRLADGVVHGQISWREP
jgi:Tol biopolymer transport system component